MYINAHFDKQVIIPPEDFTWTASPMPGVERVMLDRIGDEVARATSIVRYAPYSNFSPHTHHGGEEFIVLEGIFSDEHGDYPAGTYIRNPIGTSHTPKIGSRGATIFVKLHQFDPKDDTPCIIYTQSTPWKENINIGIETMLLHRYKKETTLLVKLAPNTKFILPDLRSGYEILILEGMLYNKDHMYRSNTWVRTPDYDKIQLRTKDAGATVFVKIGHLPLN